MEPLAKADDVEPDLSGAVLSGAMLELADLCNTDLRGANLQSAQLAGAWLSHANLEGCMQVFAVYANKDGELWCLALLSNLCRDATEADLSGEGTATPGCAEESPVGAPRSPAPLRIRPSRRVVCWPTERRA